MAHFAKLNENNVVIDVNVVRNEDIRDLPFPESEAAGVAFLTEWSGGYPHWKQTSYNNSFRKNYAGVGYTYDPARSAFIPPQPFSSWVLDEDTCLWGSPVPYPQDGLAYYWDETSHAWVASP